MRGGDVTINVLERKLAKSFTMKDLGVAKQILGMRITRNKKNCKLTLSQGEYIEKVLERFRMQNAKPVNRGDVSQDTGRDRIHVQGSLVINN